MENIEDDKNILAIEKKNRKYLMDDAKFTAAASGTCCKQTEQEKD